MAPNAPAVEGWFTTGDAPHLAGTKCRACGTYFFPPERVFCRNPACSSTELDEVALSRHGTLWSFSINHYPPPPPAVSPDPFVPYGVAAVELAREKMIVLGQIAGRLDDLEIGDEMELAVEPLADGALVWKWRKA